MAKPNRNPLVEERLTHSIIGAFYKVHRELGFGFLERVYAAAMEIELKRRGHAVQREVTIEVCYLGIVISNQRVDMLVDDKVILEFKSTERLHHDFARILYNYLRATRYEVGLLFHFGREAHFYRLICQNQLEPGWRDRSSR